MDLNKFTSQGKFLMLALDHRASIKKLINPQDPETVTDEEVIQLKSDIISNLADQFSGVLIDETWGIEACKDVCSVKPYLLPLEKSGHSGPTELEYSVEDLKNFGASGAKILLDFNPDSEFVNQKLVLSKKVSEECRTKDFPLFLEIVTHDSSFVVQSLQMFIDAGVKPHVWKLEYPGSLESCEKITQIVGETPWILLTGGSDFETFKQHLEIAVKGGTKGFLAGRSVWQEACTLSGEEKENFLKKTLRERFKIIAEIATMGNNA